MSGALGKKEFLPNEMGFLSIKTMFYGFLAGRLIRAVSRFG